MYVFSSLLLILIMHLFSVVSYNIYWFLSSTIQLVFSSSSTVYGWPKEVPCTEESPISAANPYGRTKVSFELSLLAFQCSAGLMKQIPMILKSKKCISLAASLLRLLSSQVLYLSLSFSFKVLWGGTTTTEV